MAVLKTVIGNVRGPQGERGPQGIQGIPGPKGEKGDPGDITGKLDRGGLSSKIQSGKDLYDLIEKKTGATFNPLLLFLNDDGTKEEGKLYFDKNKQGVFKCKATTTSIINSVDLFEDISNKANSDRLSNLVRIVKIRDTRFDEWILIPYPSGFSKDNSFCFGIQTETQNDAIDILKLNFDKTHYLVHQLTKDLTFSFDLCFIKI